MQDPAEVLCTELTDQTGDTDLPTSVALVRANGGAVDVQVEGYGDCCSADGQGTPVVIERYEGQLRVVIWADINQEDATHVIVLENAREDKREDD